MGAQHPDYVAGPQTSWERDSVWVDDISSASFEKVLNISIITTCLVVLIVSWWEGHDENNRCCH